MLEKRGHAVTIAGNGAQALAELARAECVSGAAHRLKGALTAVCMNRAAVLAWDLERLGKSGNLAGAESLCAQLEKKGASLLPSMRSARADDGVTE